MSADQLKVYKLKKIVGKKRRECIRNPLLYFSRNYNDHPNLSRVAMKKLSRPATSAQSERNFSTQNYLTEGRKNRSGMLMLSKRSIVKSYMIFNEND